MTKTIKFFKGKSFITKITGEDELSVEQILITISLSSRDVFYVTDKNRLYSYDEKKSCYVGCSPDRLREYLVNKYAKGLDGKYAEEEIKKRFGIDVSEYKEAEHEAVLRRIDENSEDEYLFDPEIGQILCSSSDGKKTYFLTCNNEVYLNLHNRNHFEVDLVEDENYPQQIKDERKALFNYQEIQRQ